MSPPMRRISQYNSPIDPIDSTTASQTSASMNSSGPVHHVVLEQPRTDAEEDRDRDVLHEIAGAPIDVVAVAPLVERAEGDADQRDAGREPAPARLAAHRPVMQDQHDAAEPEQQARPIAAA